MLTAPSQQAALGQGIRSLWLSKIERFNVDYHSSWKTITSPNKKKLTAVSSLLRVHTLTLAGWQQLHHFQRSKKTSSRIQSKVLTEGQSSCTIRLLMIFQYHHLALLYNQGTLGRHLKLPEVVKSRCVNFSPQRQRILTYAFRVL